MFKVLYSVMWKYWDGPDDTNADPNLFWSGHAQTPTGEFVHGYLAHHSAESGVGIWILPSCVDSPAMTATADNSNTCTIATNQSVCLFVMRLFPLPNHTQTRSRDLAEVPTPHRLGNRLFARTLIVEFRHGQFLEVGPGDGDVEGEELAVFAFTGFG